MYILIFDKPYYSDSCRCCCTSGYDKIEDIQYCYNVKEENIVERLEPFLYHNIEVQQKRERDYEYEILIFRDGILVWGPNSQYDDEINNLYGLALDKATEQYNKDREVEKDRKRALYEKLREEFKDEEK